MSSVKILGLTFLLVFKLESSGAEELPPDSAAFVESIQCVLDNLDQGDCDQEKQSCGTESWEMEAFEPVPFQACVKEICKENAESNLGRNLAQVSLETDTETAEVKKNFAPQIQKLFEAYKGLGQKAKKDLVDFPAVADNARAYQWLLDSMDDFRFNYSQATGSVELPETWGELKAQASSIFYGWDENKVRELYAISKGVSDQYRTSEEFTGFYDKVMSADARRLHLGKLEARVRELPETYPKKLAIFQNIQKLQNSNMIGGDQLSDVHHNELLWLSQELFLAEKLTGDPYSLVLANKFKGEVDKSSNFTLYDEFVTGSEEELFKSACEYAIANQATHLISSDEKKQVEEKISALTVNMTKRLKGMVSDETRAILEKNLKAELASLPPSKEEYLSKMESLLFEQAGMINAVGDKFLGSVPSYSAKNTIQLAEDACTLPLNLMGNASERSIWNSSGHQHSITMGALTLHDFDKNGLWIYAHEVGHLVSAVIDEEGSKKSKSAYQSTRECVVGQKNQDSSHMRMEEDFADLFAFYFAPEVKNGPCAFFNDGEGWKGEENILEDDPYNPKHSSSFYRLLHGQLYTGEMLPKVCEDELKNSPSRPNFRACWHIHK